MNLTVFHQRPWLLYVVAVFASLVLATWIDVREMVINPDAICYLYSAEELGKAGLNAAMHICPQAKWPFYSILLHFVVSMTQLSYTTAAFCLDGIFSAVTVVTFIAIVAALGGKQRVWWLAALVILLAHDFNILRQDIVRDHGFWAFYLLSCYSLLQFFREPRWLVALAWSFCLLVATLFRIEGAIFLLVLPWLAWCEVRVSWWQRAYYFFMLNALLLAVVGLGGLWWLGHATTLPLGRVTEIVQQFHLGWDLVHEKYVLTKTAVSEHVLTQASMRDAGVVVGLLMVSWYVVNMVGSLSAIYSVLVLYAWIKRALHFTQPARRVIWAYVLLNVLVSFVFFTQNHFLAKRYLVALSLTLMLWVPFALDQLIEKKRRILLILAGIFIFISGIGGIFHFGHSKDYIRSAGDYLAVSVPPGARLYTNDYQLMYYSQHFGSGVFEEFKKDQDVSQLAHGRWQQFDYLALLIGREKNDQTALVMQEIHLTPIAVFVSDTGDHVYVYKIPH